MIFNPFKTKKQLDNLVSFGKDGDHTLPLMGEKEKQAVAEKCIEEIGERVKRTLRACKNWLADFPISHN